MTERRAGRKVEEERAVGPCRAARKAYHSPRLIRYGDVRDVTLGPSPGLGESGNPGVLKV
jgi:hypothetical protein